VLMRYEMVPHTTEALYTFCTNGRSYFSFMVFDSCVASFFFKLPRT
jgi:hypothetical protein